MRLTRIFFLVAATDAKVADLTRTRSAAATVDELNLLDGAPMTSMLTRIAPAVLLFAARTPLRAQVSTSHVMSAPWGQLVTNSQSSFDVASVLLRRGDAPVIEVIEAAF